MYEKIAIVGQPNSGKSSLFNSLTGLNQSIGNWPGVTVEKREGVFSLNDKKFEITDLPGIYGLTQISIDEKICINFLLENNPSLIINIIDASNLERSLFLTLQLFFLDIPIVLFVNKMDVAATKGIRIDKKKMDEIFLCDIVYGSIKNEEGVEELKRKIEKNIEKRVCKIKYFRSEDRIYHNVEIVSNILAKYPTLKNFPKFYSLKLLENDFSYSSSVYKNITQDDYKTIKDILQQLTKDLKSKDFMTIDWFYSLSRGITGEISFRELSDKRSLTDEIDNAVLNRFFSIPIFLVSFFLIFFLTFFLGDIFSDGINFILEKTSLFFENNLTDGFLKAFFKDGLIGGIGAIITLIPYIFTMYFLIGFLEDSGYMARVVFIMDRFMHKIGLHGKSFISMLLGFGCSVPAILSTRTLDSPKDRIKTILIIPFIPCAARLTVMIFLGSIIFGKFAFLIIFLLFLLSIIFSIISGFIFDKFFIKGKSEGLIMELPDYHLPTLKNLFLNSYFKVLDFLKKVGGIIFLLTIIIFLLSYFPVEKEGGFIKIFGEKITPLFKPLGFDMERSVALITGFFAKESVLSTLGVLYKTDSLGEIISSKWSPKEGVIFLLFLTIYLPCIATAIVIKQETKSFFYLSLVIVYSLIFAYAISLFFKLILFFI